MKCELKKDDLYFLIYPQSHRAKFFISFGRLMMCVRSRAWQEWRHNGSYVVIKRLVFKLRLFLNLRFKKSISNTLQGNHFLCDLEHKYKTHFNFSAEMSVETCDRDGESGGSKRIYEQINGFTGIYKYW